MRLATSLIVLSFASASFAEFDIAPRISGNQIVTDAFADATEELVSNVRVFGFAFGEVPGQPYFLSDPGFHPQPGTSGFASGSGMGFSLAAPLQYWSGTGSPSFSPVGSGDTIRFDFGPSSVVSSGGAVPSPAGYSFLSVDANGEADDHLETFLLASGGSIMSPGTPTVGVYLVTMSLNTDMNGVSPSSPLYLLFGNGVSEDSVADAVFAVRDAFAPGTTVVVPEPATLGAFGLAAAMFRRRRNV